MGERKREGHGVREGEGGKGVGERKNWSNRKKKERWRGGMNDKDMKK